MIQKGFLRKELMIGKDGNIAACMERADMKSLRANIDNKQLDPEVWNAALRLFDKQHVYQVRINDRGVDFYGVVGYVCMKYDEKSKTLAIAHPQALRDVSYDEPQNALLATILGCYPDAVKIKGLCPVYDYNYWKSEDANFKSTLTYMTFRYMRSERNKKWLLKHKHDILKFELDPSLATLPR